MDMKAKYKMKMSVMKMSSYILFLITVSLVCMTGCGKKEEPVENIVEVQETEKKEEPEETKKQINDESVKEKPDEVIKEDIQETEGTEEAEDDYRWISDYMCLSTDWWRKDTPSYDQMGYKLLYLQDEEIPALVLTNDGYAEIYRVKDGIVTFMEDDERRDIDPDMVHNDNKTYDEILDELRELRTEKDTERYKDAEPWKIVYKNYLYDVMADIECITDFYEAFTFGETDRTAFFALEDITGDGIPELWITSNQEEDHRSWQVFSLSKKKRVKDLFDARISFLDPDNKIVYGHTGGVFEHYSLFSIENGDVSLLYTFDEDDNEVIGYYKGDEKISAEQMAEYDRQYDEAEKKYGGKIKGIALNQKNVDEAINLSASETSEDKIEYSHEFINSFLDESDIFEGASPRALGYNWMWFKEEDKVGEEDYAYCYSFSEPMADRSLLYHLNKVDWDNDGIDEFYLRGGVYEGLFFDMTGDVLTAVSGYGPYGMGWNGIAYFDDAYWVYSASGNMGKEYEFIKYTHGNKVADSFTYIFEIGEYMDPPSENKYYRYDGTDYDDQKEVSEEEFEKNCGENGLMYEPLPEKDQNKDEQLTKDLYEAIREFYNRERPALCIFEGIRE